MKLIGNPFKYKIPILIEEAPLDVLTWAKLQRITMQGTVAPLRRITLASMQDAQGWIDQ